jgi:hypothetical protein
MKTKVVAARKWTRPDKGTDLSSGSKPAFTENEMDRDDAGITFVEGHLLYHFSHPGGITGEDRSE